MNKTALITGASSGLGKDFATLFAEKGYDLVLTARRKKNLEEISSNLTNQFGIKVFFISCDLSDLKSTEEIYNFCEESKIQIDVLVNNAGYGLTNSFEEISLKDHIDFINVLSTSAIALTRLFFTWNDKKKIWKNNKYFFCCRLRSLYKFWWHVYCHKINAPKIFRNDS